MVKSSYARNKTIYLSRRPREVAREVSAEVLHLHRALRAPVHVSLGSAPGLLRLSWPEQRPRRPGSVEERILLLLLSIHLQKEEYLNTKHILEDGSNPS